MMAHTFCCCCAWSDGADCDGVLLRHGTGRQEVYEAKKARRSAFLGIAVEETLRLRLLLQPEVNRFAMAIVLLRDYPPPQSLLWEKKEVLLLPPPEEDYRRISTRFLSFPMSKADPLRLHPILQHQHQQRAVMREQVAMRDQLLLLTFLLKIRLRGKPQN